ncbi:MAG: hypothetical protein QM520_01805 [Gammaproteobacteria bacterium]|nr:hypothetical protein [Gammaproteobacteria bacterium]
MKFNYQPLHWSLVFRSLWREWRAPGVWFLFWGLLLGVIALNAMNFLLGHFERNVFSQAKAWLGGDVVLVSQSSLSTDWRQQAEKSELRSTMSALFPTIVRTPLENTRLVHLKAVDTHYPLYGHLRVKDEPTSSARETNTLPSMGTVWVDEVLLDSLQTKVGDSLYVGAREFKISGLIEFEPDKGFSFAGFAPRVLLNFQDLEATQLVQSTSRITWRLAVKGSSSRVDDFSRWARQKIDQESLKIRLDTLDSGREGTKQNLAIALDSIRLIGIFISFLGALAIGIAARGYGLGRLNEVAIRKTLGQTQKNMLLTYGAFLLSMVLVTSVLGGVLGFTIYAVALKWLAGIIPFTEWVLSFTPWLYGFLYASLILFIVIAYPLYQLSNLPTMDIFRKEANRFAKVWQAMVFWGSLSLFGMYWVAKDWWWVLIIQFFIFMIVLLAWLVVFMLKKVLGSRLFQNRQEWWVQGLKRVATRPVLAGVQIASLTLGIFSIMFFMVVRLDFLPTWQGFVPVDAPNRFVVNILPDQVEKYTSVVQSYPTDDLKIFPIVRARLIKINNQPIQMDHYQSDRQKFLLQREFNASYSSSLPDGNKIVQGFWQPPQLPNEVSIEQGMAETLGLQLGDQLEFDIGGSQLVSKVTSLRKLNWLTMQANFYVLFPVDSLGEVPFTLMSTFRLLPGSKPLDYALVEALPNLSVVNIQDIFEQAKSMLLKIIQVLETVLALAVGLGILILYSSINQLRHAKLKEVTLMRVLGADAKSLVRLQNAELLMMGSLAGLIASSLVYLLAWGVAHWLFQIEVQSSWLFLALVGVVLGATLAWVIGSLALRRIVNNPLMPAMLALSNSNL